MGPAAVALCCVEQFGSVIVPASFKNLCQFALRDGVVVSDVEGVLSMEFL